MGSQAKSDLWEFASEFYGDEIVKNRCLQLQESNGASVDLILWLCWLHAHRIRLEPVALEQGKNIVGGVNVDLLTGLRDLRAKLTSSHSFTRVQEQLIRKHMINAELAIEKVLLQRLQDVTARLPKADAPEPVLALNDYLEDLKVDDASAVSAFFLEHIEDHLMTQYETASA